MKILDKSKRLVIKVGSSLLASDRGKINKKVLKNIVDDISYLKSKNKEVIIVSSGAIALGKKDFFGAQELSLQESQGAAAIGQIELMTSWKSEFKKHDHQIAQILLAPSDIQNKESSQNAIATLKKLLELECVPIINENDTTATDEIKFGDNDILAAKISRLIKADHLILLSNVDGLFDKPPLNEKDLILIEEINKIDKKIRNMAGEASRLGKGGMISKVEAASICFKSNCNVIITSGLKKSPIKSLNKKTKKFTLFKKI
jgi:glutamate 5-kinase